MLQINYKITGKYYFKHPPNSMRCQMEGTVNNDILFHDDDDDDDDDDH